MRIKNGNVIVLIESNDTILQIKKDFMCTLGIIFLSIVIIFWVSKKIAKTIVKPVQDATEKQAQFISDASHELKTPLAVIRTNIDMAENEKGKSKWIDFAQNEIDSMSKMINELLLLSQIENINKSNKIEKCNISEELNLICSGFESMAFEKNIIYNINIEENINLYILKEDLEHIASTLIDNAIKHTSSGNKIIVNLKREKEYIKFEVINQGEEIPIHEREKIFDRFYRIDKSRNRNEKRYGLGLSIAKATVEKYNGIIEVECKNGFTKFSVKIK